MSSKCQMVKPAATVLLSAMLGTTAYGADSVQFASGANLGEQWENVTRTSIRDLTWIDTPDARNVDPIDPNKRSVVWWDNGERDTNLAVRSQDASGGPFGFTAFVADDILLQEGCWYHFDTITVVLCVMDDTAPRQYGLDIYEDCDGVPFGSPIYTFTSFNEVEVGQGTGDLEGFTFYAVTYDINEFIPGYERLWLSAYGISQDGEYFWLSSNDLLVQGKQGHFQIEGGPWLPVDEECVLCDPVCTDFNFVIEGQVCKVLKDNSDFITTGGPALSGIPNLTGSPIAFDIVAVDDFQVPPGPDQQICKLQVWVASNCIELIRAALYANECDCPTGDPIPLSDPFEIELLDSESHKGLPVYKVTWVNNENQPDLMNGRNYWLAISFPGNLEQSHRAYWLFKNNPTCEAININPAKYRNPFKGFPEFTPYENVPYTPPAWEELGDPTRATDHAFKLWTNVPDVCEDDDDGTSPQGVATPNRIDSIFFGAGAPGASAGQTVNHFAR